jgi:hypothetical protein
MAHGPRLAVLVVAIGLLQAHLTAAAPTALFPAVSGELRWVRGTVASVNPDALTLTLRNSDLTIARDATSRPPAIGTVVEAHYLDKRGTRRAVLVFEMDSSTELSKRPGHSYRGVVKRIKWRNVALRADAKSHGVNLVKKTRLVDISGRALASGPKEIAGLLPVGEDVIVKYEDDGGTIMVGDAMVPSGTERALEIRRLRY